MGILVRVTVMGAGNDIGRQVVAQLLARGYEVLAFVSPGAALPQAWAGTARVVFGELTDPVPVAAAVAWAQVVINALDPRLDRPRRRNALIVGTGHVVAAVADYGVPRYIGLGSPAARLCPQERPTARVRTNQVLLRMFRPRVHRQMRDMFEAATNCGAGWTIVRFFHHSRGPGYGLKYVGFLGQHEIGAWASAADIARFTVDQVLETRFIDTAPAVSSCPPTGPIVDGARG